MGCGQASKNIIAPVSYTVTPVALTSQEAQVEVKVATIIADQEEKKGSASLILDQAEALKLNNDIYDSIVDKLIEDLKL
ncbi:unnamed protein product [Blepharisma stoltei]|uniref:Lipoprotein n=1 Tax=Blepharisma stoltei TaxID=1481888 RepID=A0AAU9IS65_9CILI|nr:unnamed protein product [Blepharisma stoltei]